MASSYPSLESFVFDIPEIEDLSASFQYHYFTVGEGLYPATRDPTLDTQDLERYGYPRSITIDLQQNTLNNLSLSDSLVNSLTDREISQIITKYNNFDKLSTETDLQSQPSTRLSFMAMPSIKDTISNDFQTDSAISNFEAFSNILNTVSPEVAELVSNAVAAEGGLSTLQPFDPTSNTPIVEFNEKVNSYETSTSVQNFAIGDVVNSISSNYLSGEFSNFYSQLKDAKSLQASRRNSHQPGYFNYNDYIPNFNPVQLDPNITALGDGGKGIGILGIVAFKTKVSGNERTPERPIVLLNRDSSQIVDNSVVYGEKYEYSIHTLALVSMSDGINPMTGTSEPFAVLVLSPGGRKVTVHCIEAKPPNCVTSTNFRFMDSSMLIEWQLPTQTGHTGRPIMDIKYIQIFERDTIDDPFRLHMMMDFNDSMFRFSLPESIPLYRTQFTTMAQNFIEVPLPTQENPKIWAVCTVDAHGNSSTLSAQFRATVDSLNNYTMEHVAFPGAPKQYPNLTLVNDAFVDSIKVSGCNKVEIYHNPTATALYTSNGSSTETIVQVSQTETNDGNTTYLPSYRLQLIDLETQTDQSINIYIKEK